MGEYDADGDNHNLSCNHGEEGTTEDREVLALREQQVRNFATLLILAHGVPMLLSGDEMGRSQDGNNNAWCQDNETSWIDWQDLEENSNLFRFFCNLITFRQKHALLRPRHFEGDESGERQLSWHGSRPGKPDWSESSQLLGMHLQGKAGEAEIYLVANASEQDVAVELPAVEESGDWCLFVDTARPAEQASCSPGKEPRLDGTSYPVQGQSVVVLVKKGSDSDASG